VSESLSVEIRFNSEAGGIPLSELVLLESILPEIIRAMMQAEALNDDE
jgi:hypothetical protein